MRNYIRKEVICGDIIVSIVKTSNLMYRVTKVTPYYSESIDYTSKKEAEQDFRNRCQIYSKRVYTTIRKK